MKITLLGKDELLIEPETDFEMQWLSMLGHEEERDLIAFHKTGLSIGDYRGIKIKVAERRTEMTDTTKEVRNTTVKDVTSEAQSECNGLLACPFCGSPDPNIWSTGILTGLPKGYAVQCLHCNSAGHWNEDKDKAISAWNRRVS